MHGRPAALAARGHAPCRLPPVWGWPPPRPCASSFDPPRFAPGSDQIQRLSIGQCSYPFPGMHDLGSEYVCCFTATMFGCLHSSLAHTLGLMYYTTISFYCISLILASLVLSKLKDAR